MALAQINTNRIDVEFAGGVELLFDSVKKLRVDLVSRTDAAGEAQVYPRTIRDLLFVLRDSHIKQRPELFVQGDSVRPGILVVVNDCDWELVVSGGSADFFSRAFEKRMEYALEFS